MISNKKLISGMGILLILVLSAGAFAAVSWNDGGADHLWSNADNWTEASSHRPPLAGDSVYVRAADMGGSTAGPTISSGISAVACNLSVEVGTAGTVTMNMTGGTLDVYYAGATNCYFRLGAGSSSGTVILNMTGGTLTVSGDPGLLRVGSGYCGIVNLWGGTIDVLELMVASDTDSYIDLRNNGTLIVAGDVSELLEGYVDDGRLTAYGGSGRVVVDYNSSVNKTVARAEIISAGQSVPNPVIYTLADSGVMKYNGEYYIIGTGSSGNMYNSENLVSWGPREHVFSMDNDWATGEAGEDDEVHACDLKYIDGVFHLYWSVNRADIGVRYIGHATNTTGPMATYTEPVTNTWFSTYIDAHIFVDDDGSCYFHRVEFPMGNTCVGQVMTDPWTFRGISHNLLWLPSSGYPEWEWVDVERVNEGPFVIKYRDLYYMLYNANATWNPDYALGCAVSDTPLGFSNDDKYSYPVLAQATRGGHNVAYIGQPSLVRGPNGFEWWLIYFAEYDESNYRNQSIDRVLFFDRELYVAGPSSNLASYTGQTYTPPPAAPTFGDLFNEGTALSDAWDIKAGTWDISDGQARQTSTTGADNDAIIESQAAKNYLVEAGVKLMDAYPIGEKAGVAAWYQDADNRLMVGLDQINECWYYNRVESGVSTIVTYPLASGFDYNVYHTICVTKNDTDFYVRIDEHPAPGNPDISTPFSDAGLVGLYTQVARACFDGFTYTIGWDEYDDAITGWTTASGSWSVGSSGIAATNAGTVNLTCKGDLLEEYEFMTQVTRTSTVPSDANPHTMGICPVYIDGNNYLIAAVDLVNNQLAVSGLQDGVSIEEHRVSLESADSYNLRVIRRSDAIRLFVDGVLKLTLMENWGASQVGLYAENIQARFNGITFFKLGSQYGLTAPANEPMSDNFDDSIFSSQWQQVSIHNQTASLHGHDTLPDIVVHETNGQLQFSGCEMGDDSTSWYGRGLKYLEPVYGNAIAEFDFDSLYAYSDTGGVARAAIGLRLMKDLNNWIEIRQTDDTDGDDIEVVVCNNGSLNTSSLLYSYSSGNLKIKFNNSTGLAEYYINGSKQGVVSLSGLKNSEYYVYITAYTSNTGNRIQCHVDNFKITTSKANFNNDWMVNLTDFAFFASQWCQRECGVDNEWCQRCDFDRDGGVDVEDFSAFAANWLWNGLP